METKTKIIFKALLILVLFMVWTAFAGTQELSSCISNLSEHNNYSPSTILDNINCISQKYPVPENNIPNETYKTSVISTLSGVLNNNNLSTEARIAASNLIDKVNSTVRTGVTTVTNIINSFNKITTINLWPTLSNDFNIKAIWLADDANTRRNDALILQGNYGKYWVISLNGTKPFYNWTGVTYGTIIRTLSGSEIHSLLYWDFSSSGQIQLSYSGTDSRCNNEYLLSLSWALNSTYWWDFQIVPAESYTCISANSTASIQDLWIQIKIHSDLLWDKIIWDLNGASATINTVRSDPASVNGKMHSSSSSSSPAAANPGPKADTDFQNVQNLKFTTISNINRQITVLLNWMTWNSTDNKITDITSLSGTTYYNYEGKVDTNGLSNETNEWKILQITSSNTWTPDETNNKLPVDKPKTIVVQGWNIYINADIYAENNDDKNILVLIAKRDSTNKKNWWNIYIDPHVTNIDAVLIADGSVLSYDHSANPTYPTNLQPSQLRRQLFIYWLNISENILDTSWVLPTWSDAYMNGQRWYVEKYNINNLRYFYLRPGTWPCPDAWKYAPENWDTSSVEEYAWAWKRQCYSTDSFSNGKWAQYLRTSDSVSPVIINKNSAIFDNVPFVLKTNTSN